MSGKTIQHIQDWRTDWIKPAWLNFLSSPNVPLFLGTRKKRSNYRFLLDPPKKRSPPEKCLTTSPSSIQRKAGLLRFCFCYCTGTGVRIFALVLRIFVLVVHFDFCSLLLNIQRPIILEDRPLEAGKSVRLPYFGDDPWFCNTFGPRAESYVTKGAPGSICFRTCFVFACWFERFLVA